MSLELVKLVQRYGDNETGSLENGLKAEMASADELQRKEM